MQALSDLDSQLLAQRRARRDQEVDQLISNLADPRVAEKLRIYRLVEEQFATIEQQVQQEFCSQLQQKKGKAKVKAAAARPISRHQTKQLASKKDQLDLVPIKLSKTPAVTRNEPLAKSQVAAVQGLAASRKHWSAQYEAPGPSKSAFSSAYDSRRQPTIASPVLCTPSRPTAVPRRRHSVNVGLVSYVYDDPNAKPHLTAHILSGVNIEPRKPIHLVSHILSTSDQQVIVSASDSTDSNEEHDHPESTDPSKESGHPECTDSDKKSGHPESTDSSKKSGHPESTDSSKKSGHPESTDPSKESGHLIPPLSVRLIPAKSDCPDQLIQTDQKTLEPETCHPEVIQDDLSGKSEASVCMSSDGGQPRCPPYPSAHYSPDFEEEEEDRALCAARSEECDRLSTITEEHTFQASSLPSAEDEDTLARSSLQSDSLPQLVEASASPEVLQSSCTPSAPLPDQEHGEQKSASCTDDEPEPSDMSAFAGRDFASDAISQTDQSPVSANLSAASYAQGAKIMLEQLDALLSLSQGQISFADRPQSLLSAADSCAESQTEMTAALSDGQVLLPVLDLSEGELSVGCSCSGSHLS